MAASPIDRIVALLASDAPEKRIAAAIVLGELKARGPKVATALAATLEDGGPALQRHALDALAMVGAAKVVPTIFPLLGARDADVRDAAVNAIVSVGEPVVATVEARLPEATADERKALDRVLARLGGKQALTALLVSLDEADEESAAAAAVAMRQQVREADKRLRRGYLVQLERALVTQAKRKDGGSAATVRAAIKMLGYLEDARAVPTLQKYAASKKHPASVRQEALIALRFTLGGNKPDAKLVSALVAAAEDDDRSLAQTALMTLAGLDLPARAAGRLSPLIAHPDVERARFVIDMLSQRPTEDAAALLVEVLVEHDLRKARLAADALRDRQQALPMLVQALTEVTERERTSLVARVLRPMAGALKPAQRKKLIDLVAGRLAQGEKGWRPALEVAREANGAEVVKALRGLYDKLKRRKPPERATDVLRLLCAAEGASDEDRYALAARILLQSPRQTRAAARKADDALVHLERLLSRGFDVAAALRRDRSIDLDVLYYVGFHFIEQGHPVGEDLLGQVVDKGGRKKIAKMAKNKLQLAGA